MSRHKKDGTGDVHLYARLEKIIIRNEKIEEPKEFNLLRDIKDCSAEITISVRQKIVKDNDPTKTNFVFVTIIFNSLYKTTCVSSITAENTFALKNSSESLLGIQHNKRVIVPDIIYDLIMNSIAQARGIHQQRIANTKISGLTIPFFSKKEIVKEFSD